MAISDKLNYLIETKQLFKDRLNSLGAEITSSTTFRNYLTWLDTFYNEVSDKTDISVNGVVGRTSQESTTGKNLNYLQNLKWIVNASGKVVTNNLYWNAIIDTTNNNSIYISGNYSLLSDGVLRIGLYSSYPQFGSQGTRVTYSGNGALDTTNCNYVLLCYGTSSGHTIEEVQNSFMVSYGTTMQPYEPYTGGQPSPNPDYPQPINNLSGDVTYKVSGKNLFDKDNANTLNAYFTANIPTITSSYSDRIIYIPCQPNTTYTISKLSSPNARAIGYTSAIPTISASVDGVLNITANDTTGTITTGENAKYLLMRAWNEGQDSGTSLQQMLDSIQIEQGSTTTSYEPYISQTFNIPLKSKNLFDGLTTKGSYNTVTGKVETTIYNMWRNTNPIGVNPNNDYVFSLSGTALSVSFRVFYYDINKMYISTGTTTNGKFITPADCYYVNWHSTALYTNYPNGLTNAMIEKGSTPTDYEPYYDIELCNIDTYEDKIYSSDGRFYLYKNIGKVVLNGSETDWNYYTPTNKPVFYLGVITNFNYLQQENLICYSNYYQGKGQVNSFNDVYDLGNNVIAFRTAYKRLVIRNDNITSVSDFQTWLSTHNTSVYYVLATPTTTEITQENYPSLYNALKQIQDYLTAYKINKEFILGYSSPEIEY